MATVEKLPSQQAFVYQPLHTSQKQIRVLCLAPGQRSDPLQASFEVIPIDDEHVSAYETISYVWGDATKNKSMTISGGNLTIPTNTAAALRRMRHLNTARTLWIDAVCINQEDVAERGQQVSLMGSIYSRSQRNLIHLTDDEEAGRRIEQTVASIDLDIQRETDGYRKFRERVYLANGEASTRKLGTTSDNNLAVLEELVQLPWFRRLWVIQEARLSPLNVCILGASQCNFFTLLRVTEWSRNELRGRLGAGECLDCLQELFDTTDRELGWHAANGHSSLGFLELLFAAQFFERSEPRDGVFAILGMLSELDGVISPDYSRSVASVMRDATRAVLSSLRNLLFLRYVKPRSQDLESEEGSSWMFRADRRSDIEHDSETFATKAHAAAAGLSNASLPLRRPEQDVPFLDVEGITVDELQLTSLECSRRVCWDALTFADWLCAAIEAFVPYAAEKLGSESGLLEILSHVVVGGIDRSGAIADGGDIAAVGMYLRLVLDDCRRAERQPRSTTKLQKALGIIQTRFELGRLRNRRLFATKSGRFGLGIEAVRPGDKVVILRDGDWPFILRPLGQHYQFVGAAYVYGIMHGEAVTEHLTKGGQEQIFTLR